MAVRVAAWNLASGLSYKDTAPQLIDGIADIDADVVLLSDAYRDYGQDVSGMFPAQLGCDHILTIPYVFDRGGPGKAGNREDHLVVLGRVPFWGETLTLPARNALSFAIEDPATEETIFGIAAHLDDQSEATRQAMVVSMLEQTRSSRLPAFIAGDLNALHRYDLRATALNTRFARRTVEILPEIELKNTARCLIEMANGGTLSKLKDAGFYETDPKHLATMKLGRIALFQLDHIMHTSLLRSHDFMVHEYYGSDHKAISVTLEKND